MQEAHILIWRENSVIEEQWTKIKICFLNLLS